MTADLTLEEFYLPRTVVAAANAARSGHGPFAAVVVTANGLSFWGVNSVTKLNDPTAHAEVQAIREAAGSTGFDLSGAVLFSSCEPCPMCLTAAMWARIDEIVWAASSEQAAEAGFDDSEFYTNVAHGLPRERARRGRIDSTEAFRPFAAWQANESRVAY